MNGTRVNWTIRRSEIRIVNKPIGVVGLRTRDGRREHDGRPVRRPSDLAHPRRPQEEARPVAVGPENEEADGELGSRDRRRGR